MTDQADRHRNGWLRRKARRWVTLRDPIPLWEALLLGATCLAMCLGVWWFVTRGETGEERLVSPSILPSPAETLNREQLGRLWFDYALTRNTLVTLRRVITGFGLAVLVGVPVGVLAGCFSRVQAFLTPLIIFGRNIPVAALIPITFFMFGTDERQKVLFIFLASVAFIAADTARAVLDVSRNYVDTAYTLGANRSQVILKVLVPLAMPHVWSSLRLLFGLAFGYIMLAELIKIGGEAGGLGYLINTAQRRGLREPVYQIVLIIPLIALTLDLILYWMQRELFPYRYGGAGVLHHLVRGSLHLWDDFKGLFWRKRLPGGPAADGLAPAPPPAETK